MRTLDYEIISLQYQVGFGKITKCILLIVDDKINFKELYLSYEAFSDWDNLGYIDIKSSLISDVFVSDTLYINICFDYQPSNRKISITRVIIIISNMLDGNSLYLLAESTHLLDSLTSHLLYDIRLRTSQIIEPIKG